MKPIQIACSACHVSAAPTDWRCTVCGGLLEIMNLPRFDAEAIDANVWSMWRYGALLPAEPKLTLGEGMTPLVPVTVDGQSFHAKLEHLNPTGSYKDRGAAVLLNHFAAHGVGSVVETSSGNAGAAAALYAAGLGMRARIYTPANAVGTKKRQIQTVAELVAVPGARSAVDAACEAAAAEPGVAYATHAWSPLFIAGQMTAAWEIWEQLGRRAPGAIVTPVGMGCLLRGLYHGFGALLDAGLIDRIPRIFAVQAANSDPVVQGWEQGLDTVPDIHQQPSVADGIMTLRPIRETQVLHAIRASDGMALRVTEDDILAAHAAMLQRGLLIEPTSATTVAALPQVRQHYPGDDLVLLLTGNGLKTL
ncbi:MAG: pyridoxal-phosphate dependent enzyme [Armatimonadetes bacterium]|nr:pyridoxal-phosphate dependent enzyme [Anaerolineae bacterium]